jgi:hypothetical protein
MITLQELKSKLMQLDEVTLMETLEITSEDLVHRFSDLIENNYDYLTGEFDEDTPWDND